MISRYSLTADATTVSQRFTVDPTPAYEMIYNAAPAQLLPVMTQESPNGMSFFYWGAPPAWAKNKPLGERLINTHTEHLTGKPAIRKMLKKQRCLVPADGFFIWRRIGKKASVPYRFTLPDKSPFGMAGLWEEYEDEQNVPHHTFSLITAPSNPSVLDYSERMPAILTPEQERVWLSEDDRDDWPSLLSACPHELVHYSVSTMVNDPTRNDKRVVLPAPAADQFGNLTLFD